MKQSDACKLWNEMIKDCSRCHAKSPLFGAALVKEVPDGISTWPFNPETVTEKANSPKTEAALAQSITDANAVGDFLIWLGGVLKGDDQ